VTGAAPQPSKSAAARLPADAAMSAPGGVAPEVSGDVARHAVAARVLAALDGSPRRTLFVTELAVLLDQQTTHLTGQPETRREPQVAGLDQAIADLQRCGLVLVVDHTPPDRHLAGSDLRVVTGPLTTVPRDAAERKAEAFWNEWWIGFASSHRCG
jgi:hypothetical protein